MGRAHERGIFTGRGWVGALALLVASSALARPTTDTTVDVRAAMGRWRVNLHLPVVTVDGRRVYVPGWSRPWWVIGGPERYIWWDEWSLSWPIEGRHEDMSVVIPPADGEPGSVKAADESLRPAGRVREEIRRERVRREMERLGWKDGKPPPEPTVMERAQGALREGKYANAVPLLKQHLEAHPEDADALRLLGVAHLGAGASVDGSAAIRAAYVLDPSLATRRLTPDSAGLSAGALRALDERARAYANNAKSGSAYLASSVLAQANGHDALAKVMLERAVKAGLQAEVADALAAALAPKPIPPSATPPSSGTPAGNTPKGQ